MSQSGFRWRHIIINTHGTWLHGDPRGFRSRGQRIHSSGDYKNPPPPTEHEALHRYQRARSHPPVELPREVWAEVGYAIVENLRGQQCRTAALAVTPTHVHHLTNMPDDVGRICELVGWAKRFATRVARRKLPVLKEVELWAEGEAKYAVDTIEHFQQARKYILEDQGADAWTLAEEPGFDR